MNRKELIAEVAEQLDLSKVEAEDLTMAFMAIFKEGLKSGSLTLPGLGKLKSKETAARTGKTPAGQAWTKPASTKIVFVASSNLE